MDTRHPLRLRKQHCKRPQVQDEGDVDQLLDVEYEDDAVEDQLENEFGDMPGAAQVRAVYMCDRPAGLCASRE